LKDISEIIIHQAETYPKMKAQDLYKLLYQASMGPGHAVKNVGIVTKWLDDEIAFMDNYDDKDIVEVLNGAAGLVKVNLRPYLSSGGTKEKLLDAFIRTANNFNPDKEKLHDYLRVAELLAENGMIKFDVNELKEFFINAEKDGYPAIHHSEIYRSEYKPAYRVLQKKYLG
jgi:hypothetical protein